MPLPNTFLIPRDRSQYFPYVAETWAPDTSPIDLNLWATAITGGSTVARDMTDTDFAKVRLTAAASNTARLRTTYRFRATPGLITASTMIRSLFVEWEMKLTTVANIDNATTFWGLTDSTTGDRTTANIIGFGLTTDALRTITDSAGTETTSSPTGLTLTNRNLYRITVNSSQVIFTINGNVAATHTTNLPNILPYLTFYVTAEAGGSGIADIGFINLWYRGVDSLL